MAVLTITYSKTARKRIGNSRVYFSFFFYYLDIDTTRNLYASFRDNIRGRVHIIYIHIYTHVHTHIHTYAHEYIFERYVQLDEKLFIHADFHCTSRRDNVSWRQSMCEKNFSEFKSTLLGTIFFVSFVFILLSFFLSL